MRTVHVTNVSRLRNGQNCMMNRLTFINNVIDHDWLNLSFESFKVNEKTYFWTDDDFLRNDTANSIS